METTPVRIEIWRHRARGEGARVAGDFGAIVRSERVPDVLGTVAALGGVVIAALAGEELRGYATLVPSSALRQERWENLPDTFELGSIEVARSARGRGIGTALLASLPSTLPIERLLLFARGFVSHWDLALGMRTPIDHRRMLLHMLGRAGFQRWETDDPEVGDHPLGFLAVRTGLHTPSTSLLAMMERAGETERAGEMPW